jgi:UDP-N-acetylglucosamine--N-acetylmuramyl-(pentapeptide) pyrophosphoryl-undecaprenol N-acetylglucosamine transferase
MRAQVQQPVVIAAGGTGGHFFPAEALAAELLARGQRVVLLTDARSSAAKSPVFKQCESHIVPGAGIAGRSLRRALAGALAIGRGVLAARRIMAPLAPAVVIGFGGYPAVAPLLAARTLAKRPLLILHDQNAVLGKANQLLARICDHIALSFPETSGLPPGRAGVFTGNPVRPAILAQEKAPYAPPGDEIHLLVLGGSLGARVFGSLVPAALALLPAALRARIRLTMQCPAQELEGARAALAACQIAATLAPFFEDVAALLADAHLVIARSGGSTVAELAVVGRPAIFIPLGINADQRANAGALAAIGGAWMLEQAGLTPETLAEKIEIVLMKPEELQIAAAHAASAGRVDAAVRLADMVMEGVAR